MDVSSSSSETTTDSSAQFRFTFLGRLTWPVSDTFCRRTRLPRALSRRLARLRISVSASAVFLLLSTATHAAPLSLLAFAQLASSCAPHVAVETLAAVARTETGFDALTLHDNSSGRSYHPASREDAIALGVELVTVDGHSVDLGLMQINSANLPSLSLSVADAFEPCRSLAAADRVLVDGYTAPAAGQDAQPAIQQTLSRYNTGDPARGVANGYVGRVQASAELVVPALRVRGDTGPEQAPIAAGEAPIVAQPLPPLPPAWDVYARAKDGHGEVFGASPVPTPAAVPAALPVSVATASSAPTGPVPAQRSRIEAMNNVR